MKNIAGMLVVLTVAGFAIGTCSFPHLYVFISILSIGTLLHLLVGKDLLQKTGYLLWVCSFALAGWNSHIETPAWTERIVVIVGLTGLILIILRSVNPNSR